MQGLHTPLYTCRCHNHQLHQRKIQLLGKLRATTVRVYKLVHMQALDLYMYIARQKHFVIKPTISFPPV